MPITSRSFVGRLVLRQPSCLLVDTAAGIRAMFAPLPLKSLSGPPIQQVTYTFSGKGRGASRSIMLNRPTTALLSQGSRAFSPGSGHTSTDSLPGSPHAHVEPDSFICISSTLRRMLLQSRAIAAHARFALLEGEPGTGKHLFAQTLHQHSTLADLPFRRADARDWLATDCDAASLKGTLYLDRVDLLSATAQNLLLGFVKMLQTAPPSRFLLLASAHTSLRHMASRNLFLPDLAFRLSAVQFTLPPLREHREDIAPITQTLIDRICRRHQQPTAVLAPGALPRLLQHDWPGNVHELACVLESAILASTSGILRHADLTLTIASLASTTAEPVASGPAPAGDAAQDLSLDAMIQRHIRFVLEKHRGNKLRAARQLGISRSTLYRLLAGETAAL